MSIFTVIGQQESSGGRNLYNPVSTSSGHAQGLYGITTGTWTDFAPQAGIDLSQYPTPNSASFEQQTNVASLIPLHRWAPSTVAAVQNQYGPLDTSQTLGTLAGGARDATGNILNPDSSGLNIPGDPFGMGGGLIDSSGATTAANTVAPPGSIKGVGDWFGTAFADIENLALRGGVILVAIVLIAAAAFAFARERGAVPKASVIVRRAASSVSRAPRAVAEAV